MKDDPIVEKLFRHWEAQDQADRDEGDRIQNARIRKRHIFAFLLCCLGPVSVINCAWGLKNGDPLFDFYLTEGTLGFRRGALMTVENPRSWMRFGLIFGLIQTCVIVFIILSVWWP